MTEENPENVGDQAVANAVANAMQNAILQGVQAMNTNVAALNQLTISLVTAAHDKLLGVTDTSAERQQDIKAAQTTNPQTGQTGVVPPLTAS